MLNHDIIFVVKSDILCVSVDNRSKTESSKPPPPPVILLFYCWLCQGGSSVLVILDVVCCYILLFFYCWLCQGGSSVLVILDVVCCYLLLFLLHMNIRICNNRCLMLDEPVTTCMGNCCLPGCRS